MKRKKPDPPEGAADWIVTYGDVMSLLLTFFVMLFSFSTIDAVKWQQIVESLRGRMGVSIHTEQQPFNPIKKDKDSSQNKSNLIDSIVERGNPIPLVNSDTEIPSDPEDTKIPPEEIGNTIDEDFGKLYGELMRLITYKSGIWDVDIIRNEESIILRFGNKILFESGIADLDTEAADIIYEIVGVIAEYESVLDKLVIEGNTDNIPINTARYRDNFELSIYRALNVFYFIQQEDLFPAKKIEIKGYGENNPIASNDTEEGRALNRRTDIVIMKAEVKE